MLSYALQCVILSSSTRCYSEQFGKLTVLLAELLTVAFIEISLSNCRSTLVPDDRTVKLRREATDGEVLYRRRCTEACAEPCDALRLVLRCTELAEVSYAEALSKCRSITEVLSAGVRKLMPALFFYGLLLRHSKYRTHKKQARGFPPARIARRLSNCKNRLLRAVLYPALKSDFSHRSGLF